MKTYAELKAELGIPDFHVEEVSPALVSKTRVSHYLRRDGRKLVGPKVPTVKPPSEDLSRLNSKVWHEQQKRKQLKRKAK